MIYGIDFSVFMFMRQDYILYLFDIYENLINNYFLP